MKTKYASILLFILVFAGVALLGYTQVGAQPDPTFKNLGDGQCQPEETDYNQCISPFGYTVEVLPDENGIWPLPYRCPGDPEGTTDCKEFRYRATSLHTKKQCRTTPTWNWFVMTLMANVGDTIDYLADTIPPGAQILLHGDSVGPKCDYVVAEPDYVLAKWNPSLNCGYGNFVDFSIITFDNVQVGYCDFSWVVTSQVCEGGMLKGPLPITAQSMNILAITDKRVFCDGRVVVTFDQCSREPSRVLIDGEEGVLGDFWICGGDNPPSDGNIPSGTDCVEIDLTGPRQTGCVICGEVPAYFHGPNAWFKKTSSE